MIDETKGICEGVINFESEKPKILEGKQQNTLKSVHTLLNSAYQGRFGHHKILMVL